MYENRKLFRGCLFDLIAGSVWYFLVLISANSCRYICCGMVTFSAATRKVGSALCFSVVSARLQLAYLGATLLPEVFCGFASFVDSINCFLLKMNLLE